MIDREVIRTRLSPLGFNLERECGGFNWIVRDRRAATAMPALAAHKGSDSGVGQPSPADLIVIHVLLGNREAS
jgi:hypothetical protein